MEKDRIQPAAYLPFSTFLTALDHLAAITIPNKIEMGTFPSLAHTAKSQLLSAFKFFELTDEQGTPQPILTDLAHKKDERRVLIRQLLETYYPDIVALDFAKVTPSQLESALTGNRYNVSGDTRKKAKTFLLKAAQFAGFTVHPLLTKITRNRGNNNAKKVSAATTKQTNAGTNGSTQAPPKNETNRQPEAQGTQKTIQLQRGGSLTLTVAVNVLELTGSDRNFVFELIDKLNEYEDKVSAQTNGEQEKT